MALYQAIIALLLLIGVGRYAIATYSYRRRMKGAKSPPGPKGIVPDQPDIVSHD